jgi:hypothetical protein
LNELPVACALTDSDLAERQAELRSGVLAAAEVVESLREGLRWRFASSPGLLSRLATMIEGERECCRFLRFRLEAEPDRAGVTLEVTGPDGSEDFLRTWLPEPQVSTSTGRS